MRAAAKDTIWLNKHPQKTALAANKIVWRPTLCGIYNLQVVTSLTEAPRVAWQEIMELVTEILRQLRIGKGEKRVYRGCDADNRSP